MATMKANVEQDENLRNEHITMDEKAYESFLTDEHKQYIMTRHGTLELDPLPSMSPNDPLNWPSWKKDMNIMMVAFHAMMTTFAAAALVPGYESYAEEYGIAVSQAAYLTSAQIIVSGWFPLLWNPISKRFGRRPVLLFSTITACIINIGGGFCTSYATQMTCRVLNAACICPCLGFGSGVVTELFFRHERAQKMGWWTLLVTLGTPCGPFIMGFVVQRVSVHWISWILAIVNFLQFLGYLFFNSETLSHPGSSNTQFIGCETKWGFRRIDKAPFSLQDFLNPFTVCKYPKVLIPVIAYALCFCYANIALIVMMPISFGKKFGLDAQGIGLQFIALIIGSVLGEQVSGPLSDTFLNRYAAKTGRRAPVQRLWLAYPGFLTIFVGILVWGIQLQNAKQGHWNVTPLVGAAIAAFGNQVITTTLITFAVDSYPEKSSHIGGAVNVVRQTWGFIGPFYFPDMFEKLGFAETAGIFCVIVFALGMVPIMWLHLANRSRKEAKSESEPDA